MAVTIVRSIWIDDDGSGTVGTVINQAVHTALYNEIDTALAKVAQLAGGNSFTGNQVLTGTGIVVINGAAALLAAKLTVIGDAASSNGIAVQNLNAGIAGMGFFNCVNNAGAAQGAIVGVTLTSVAYNTTSDARLKVDAGPAMDLMALRAVVVHDFTWTADGVRDRGVFAQEAYALYPRANTPGTDERTARGDLARPWMTDYSKFVPDLIVGWQQHDAEIAELRAALSARMSVEGS